MRKLTEREMCDLMAYRCLLKIEKPGLKHKNIAALNDEPTPRWVVKNSSPTYDLAYFPDVKSMLVWLTEYDKDFERFNKAFFDKMTEEFYFKLDKEEL